MKRGWKKTCLKILVLWKSKLYQARARIKSVYTCLWMSLDDLHIVLYMSVNVFRWSAYCILGLELKSGKDQRFFFKTSVIVKISLFKQNHVF